ncbi:MAG: hypothetical protein ACXVH1_24980 [Solirubrobacteraceae bacterium]
MARQMMRRGSVSCPPSVDATAMVLDEPRWGEVDPEEVEFEAAEHALTARMTTPKPVATADLVLSI